jgi:hypothetical protein
LAIITEFEGNAAIEMKSPFLYNSGTLDPEVVLFRTLYHAGHGTASRPP